MKNHGSALPDGVFAATLTPQRADLGVDHEALAAHCRWLLAHGCNGVAVLGTTGEANSFTAAERMELLERLIGHGLPSTPLMVGTGCCAVPDTVTLSRHAVAQGVGGVLMLPPFYYKKVGDDGLFAAYDQVIQKVGDARLRVYLYHIPQLTGVPISHTLIARLTRAYPQTVVGIKDSSGDWNNIRTMCESFPGFRVYAGTEKFLRDLLRIGGAGCISATANVTCALAGKLFANRDSASTEALQARLSAMREAIESFPVIPALKRLMSMHSGRREWLNLRPPHMALSDERAAALTDALEKLGFRDELPPIG